MTRRISPVTAHLQRMAAAEAVARTAAPARASAAGHEHELLLAQLYEHRKTLKDIQSVERKIEAKRAMLANYDAYLDGVLQADAGGDDVVLATVLVWHIDAGHWQRALQLAAYALKHGLRLPDQYQRDLPTLLLDEFSDAAIAGQLAGDDAAQALAAVLQLTEGRDAPDQARAKLHKAIGWAAMGKTRTRDVDIKALPLAACQAAMGHLSRAIELDAQAGVKKDVERLQRRIESQQPPN
ncbi:MAG: phage terminase small subunit [Desulfovibrionaceae bacterium]|jgi:hypothetical protein|nr:phage terminase small subunit [Desulfovibrionaceae bacterium]